MGEPRHLSIPKEAADTLSPLKEKIRSAPYQPCLDCKICLEENIIVEAIPFVKSLPPPAGDASYSHVRVTVVHFERSASIPVPPKSTAAIVPVHIVNEGAKVAGHQLAEGDYWEITKDEQVEPDFYALLVLFEKPEATAVNDEA